MSRVVLDTNVLLSGVLSKASAPGQLLQAWRVGQFELVISSPILTELTRALAEPYFRQRLSAVDIADLTAALAGQATLIVLAAVPPRVATAPGGRPDSGHRGRRPGRVPRHRRQAAPGPRHLCGQRHCQPTCVSRSSRSPCGLSPPAP